MQKLLLSAAVLVLVGAGCATNVDTGAEADVSGAAGTQPAGQGGDFDDTPQNDDSGLGASADIDAEADMEGDGDAMVEEDDQADNVVITYDGDGFQPSAVTVSTGTTVMFQNESGGAFWPASDVHPIHAEYDGTTMSEHCAGGADAFDACSQIASGGSFDFTFDKVGEWNYHNHLRATHGGTITVTP